MFVMRMALAAVAFLALFAATARAGEWRAEEALPLNVSPPPHGQMRSARYVSERLVKDEEVILAVSPPRWRRGEIVSSDKARAYGWDPEHYAFMLMSIILTSGQTPISGFDGVSTFPAHAKKDWISFYRPKDAAQKPLASGACGLSHSYVTRGHWHGVFNGEAHVRAARNRDRPVAHRDAPLRGCAGAAHGGGVRHPMSSAHNANPNRGG